MAVLFLVAFAFALVEHDDLVSLHERLKDFGGPLCSADGWSADLDCAVVVDEEHLFEFEAVAFVLFGQVMNEDLTIFFYFELLTSNFYDSVHDVFIRITNETCGRPSIVGMALHEPHRFNGAKL